MEVNTIDIKINTSQYNKFRGVKIYDDIAKEINYNWGTAYNKTTISRLFTGKNLSFKAHYLLCENLGIEVNKVYEIIR